VPLVLCVELVQLHRGDSLVSRLVARVVQRPDEITELLAFYALANARSGNKVLNRLSKKLQKGLALSFNRFDGYQLAKYDRDGAVRLRDALFLVHPNTKAGVVRPIGARRIADAVTLGKPSCRPLAKPLTPLRRTGKRPSASPGQRSSSAASSAT
jgi:hypothetical protein